MEDTFSVLMHTARVVMIGVSVGMLTGNMWAGILAYCVTCMINRAVNKFTE